MKTNLYMYIVLLHRFSHRHTYQKNQLSRVHIYYCLVHFLQ